jgi:serine/threonine protein kinase
VQPGDVLLEKYRIEEVLGTGGMGKVVRASHLFLQQEFAIKVLLPHMADSAETVSRFLREAQSTSKLKSEHIARVFDVGRMADGVPFMVMEYLQGNDLNQIIRHHGPQRPNIVCDLMLQACEGMAEAHALGVVHRDIKPSNFFITTRPDGTMLLKILDFGISKTPVGVTELTGAATVIGTPTYMSPEQMKSGRAADQRSDVWSMGIVMYQLLNGRPPFVGESYPELVIKVGNETPQPILSQLPPGLMQVIMTCLEKDPNNRQQSVAELARMIAPYASDPVQGTQSAQRTTRTLANRGARAPGTLPVSQGGGLAPLSPAQLTPRSWPPSAPTTGSHGRGQVTHTHTHHVRGTWRIGRVIGAFLVLALAGAGGFLAKSLLTGSDDADDTTHVAAPPTSDPAPPPVAVPSPEPPKPPEAKPEVTADPATAEVKPEPKPEDAKLESESLRATNTIEVAEAVKAPTIVEPREPAVKTETPAKPAVTATKPVVTTKPVTKPTTTTATKPTTTKPVVKKKKRNEDLFNTRH